MNKLYDFDMVKDCTKVYRRLIDCFSYPMEKVELMKGLGGFDSEFDVFLGISATLVDNEASFFVERNIQLEALIKDVTGAKASSVQEADYIFIPSSINHSSLLDIFVAAKKGTFEDPHKSATIILLIKNEQSPKKVVEILNSLDIEYPLGLDLILVFEDSTVAAVPRLIKEVC